MIFDIVPENWQELQSFVAQLFSECGFPTEISKVVELVRGKKEIDVYTQDVSNEYKPIILVECKYWNSSINQEVVHSFRTVVNDFGANVGFIVSKVGFQKGCYEAAKNTNIKLIRLNDLENMYFERWKNEMAKKYRHYSDILFPYWDYPGKRVEDGGVIDFKKLQLIHTAYSPICSLGPVDDLSQEFSRKLPISIPILNDNLDIIGEETISTYRQYFTFIEKNKEKAIKHFKILYRED